VQPIIRYDIGDRVVLRPQPCACGSPLPAIEVQGRVDDTVVLQGEGGRAVRLLPLALTTVLEDDAGVYDFQIVQDGAHALRLSVAGEAAPDATKRARSALAAFLDRQGLSGVHIDAHSCPACERGRSGKVQRVVAAPVKEAETV
jgi:phenylacetate-coenzyme A ligase PaaK-like adenylate-forming protein